ncbi:hypothetical protein RCO48_28325 [Peribacillus frigoritolerans]|nr:hypothetical protein [Peribacillus frigoritolerans]
MTSKSMRSFAGGLVVAAGLCGAVYFFGPGEATGTSEKQSEDEMKRVSGFRRVCHTFRKKNGKIRLLKHSRLKIRRRRKKETVKEPTEKNHIPYSSYCV